MRMQDLGLIVAGFVWWVVRPVSYLVPKREPTSEKATDPWRSTEYPRLLR